MANQAESQDQIKKHCELQWNSKLILSKNTIEGTEEQKQKTLNQRIKKFHLYNTPQLACHIQNQELASEENCKSFSMDQTIDFNVYEKSLVLIRGKTSDINYLGVLFREHGINIKSVKYLKDRNIQIHFDCNFDKVQKVITRIDNNQNHQNGEELYKFKQLSGYNIIPPRLVAKVVIEAKPGSREYLYDCAKSRFFQIQTEKIERQRQRSLFSRSRSRSRQRTSSVQSFSSRRSTLNFDEKFQKNFVKQRRQIMKNNKFNKKKDAQDDRPYARRSLHLEMIAKPGSNQMMSEQP